MLPTSCLACVHFVGLAGWKVATYFPLTYTSSGSERAGQGNAWVACLANHPYGGLELGRRTHVRVVLVSTCFVRIFSLVLHLEPHARDVGDYNSSGVHPVH